MLIERLGRDPAIVIFAQRTRDRRRRRRRPDGRYPTNSSLIVQKQRRRARIRDIEGQQHVSDYSKGRLRCAATVYRSVACSRADEVVCATS